MSKSIKQLFAAIAELKNEKQKETQLKKIEELAQKVLKKHNTLNVFQEDSDYVHTPLEAAIAAGSIRVFQLLVRLGADPFWKPKPDRPSAIDFFINHYFSRDHYHERGELFEWVLTDKGSPLFTWAKLKTNQKLDEAFKKANLKKPYLNELPIHVAIQAGSMDLVQQVVDAAGGLQRAGDISRMSVLSTALDAVLEGQKNSLEILKYLLEQGSSPQTSDVEDAPQLIHLLTRMTGSNIEEFIALVAVNLLLHHGASLDVTDARGCTPLMLAMEVGMPKLFVLLLDKADARTLNEQAQILLNYLLFQLLDKEESRLSTSDVLIALRQLKEKGLKFDQTIDYHSPADPFENATHSPWREIAVQNMSLLHFYVENMTRTGGDPFQAIDHHLEVIQALIAHGANPHAKAIFSMQKNPYSYGTDSQSSMELTASQYARNIVERMLGHYYLNYGAYWIKTYEEEHHFLSVISHETHETQISLHKKFHQLRNLERVLSGNKPLPYSGLPDLRKLEKLALNKPNQSKSATVAIELDPIHSQDELLSARNQKNQGNWQARKKALVNYVKEAESLEDFLARVDRFKAPLQLHFNISTDAKGATTYGSTLYRFFHFFDAHQFPNSWETLRKFGQETYGVDINTPYDEVSTDLKIN